MTTTNTSTNPAILSAAYFANLLTETEKAHQAFVSNLRADGLANAADFATSLGPVITEEGRAKFQALADEAHAAADAENARWADWYGRYIATRIAADTAAESWTPTPRPFYPGYDDDVDATGNPRCVDCGKTRKDLSCCSRPLPARWN